MVILKTKHLILRTWKEQDLVPMSEINQDSLVCEFLPEIGNRTSTKKLIRRFMDHYEKYGFTAFVGLLVTLFEAHFTPAVEIGWRLGTQHWGRGYATEAAKSIVNFAFTTLKLEEVVSFTVENNIKSRRVLEKIGMLHNPKDDFDHPKLSKNSLLCRHVLYRLIQGNFRNYISTSYNQEK